jgi:hypothetical protein
LGQRGAILYHISAKAGELLKVIDYGIRDGKTFMVPQGEKTCHRAGIDTVSLGFPPLGFMELACPVGVNLHHLIAMGEEEVSQGNSIIPRSLDADEDVLFVWGKLFQSAQEFLKALTIDVKGEHTGIRILGKVPNTSLVPTLTDIYSCMILSQALTSFASILFFSFGRVPPCHHTRTESEVSRYWSRRITYQRSSSGSTHSPSRGTLVPSLKIEVSQTLFNMIQ